ncbi:hypothetical protein J6590_017879 [Homalodisca vitripennis]|nr:hypothetical protein J6590_017879 [Homalodisca vitripennis]
MTPRISHLPSRKKKISPAVRKHVTSIQLREDTSHYLSAPEREEESLDIGPTTRTERSCARERDSGTTKCDQYTLLLNHSWRLPLPSSSKIIILLLG